MKKKFSILTLIFSFITLLYCDGLINNCTISKDANDGVSIVEKCPLEEQLYYCGPKTRDYTDTPPPGGIVLVPIVIGIVFVFWLVANIYSKFEEGIKKVNDNKEKNNDLYNLYHSNYTKIGNVNRGIQLVKLSEKKYAYIKETGKPLLNEIYNEAEPFTFESAIVIRSGSYALLNYTGSYIINFDTSSYIYAIGECIMVQSSCYHQYYICNRQGKKIYPDEILNAKIDNNGNYILHKSYLLDGTTEVVIDKEGNIITPLHNLGEQPQKINKDIAIYHAESLCGLVDIKENKVILDATKYKFGSIGFFSRTKQYIAHSGDVDYIFDEKLNLQGELTNKNIREPLTSEIFKCIVYKTNSRNHYTICKLDGTTYPNIEYSSILCVSDSGECILAEENEYDSNHQYIIHNINTNAVSTFDYDGEMQCRTIENESSYNSKATKKIKYLKYKKNGLYGMINLDAQVLIPFKYTKIYSENDYKTGTLIGFSCFIDGNNWDAYNEDGIPCSIDKIKENQESRQRERDIEDWLNFEINGDKYIDEMFLSFDV